MSNKDILLRTIPDDAVIAPVCPGCERAFGRAILATSESYDPVDLRAQEGVMSAHARHYGRDHIIEILDLQTNQVAGTIPQTPRLQ